MTPVARMGLLGEFVNALHRLTGEFPLGAEEAFECLAQRYETSERAYHNLGHIEMVLYWAGRTGKTLSPKDHAILSLATFYHDAVYDAREKDNEERSAAFARHELGHLGVRGQDVAAVERLILLTKSHQAAKFDRIGRAIIDADLAILQAPADEYDRYAAAIRQEYAWVPEEEYRVGRTRVLESLMTGKLFTSPLLDEDVARANMRREIEGLAHHL